MCQCSLPISKLVVLGHPDSMLAHPKLECLTLSHKAATFPRRNGKYIIQDERKVGFTGWLPGEQQALQALSWGYFWGTSWEGAVLVDLPHLPVTEALEYKAERNPAQQ